MGRLGDPAAKRSDRVKTLIVGHNQHDIWTPTSLRRIKHVRRDAEQLSPSHAGCYIIRIVNF
jgi:hypothetical protein